ncbi:MAG: N-acetyltransferase family protein [Gaiellaceae bacterium]
MTAVEVRPAHERDVETMAAIYVSAARQGWAHIFGRRNLETVQPPVDRLRGEIASADPRQQVLVADREGRVVAYAVVRPSQDDDVDSSRVGELDAFYCDPPVWGQGVGRALMAAVIEALRQSGFVEATLWTSKDNHRPRRIYEVAGWTPDGATREKPWRGANWRELRYRIRL